MSKENNLIDFLTDIANTIRAQTGSQAPINAQDFSSEIASISADTSLAKSIVDRTVTTISANDLSGITMIGNSAFYNCIYLQSIEIPSGVTNIQPYAFYGCGLRTAILPSTITEIRSSAFNSCSQLTSITINATTPPTLQSANAFQNTNDCPIYVPAGSVNAYKTDTNWVSLATRIQAIQ